MLADRGFRMPVIIISAHGDLAAARTAFKAGALDFLEKPIQQAVLLPAIAAALEHDRSWRDRERATAAFRERIGRLSERERQVMWHVADGLQNREIAQLLGLSPRTVEIYKARMLEKLQVRRPAELMRSLQDIPRDA
jgi:RNA polymerase sigma factor (sigma-70 family)